MLPALHHNDIATTNLEGAKYPKGKFGVLLYPNLRKKITQRCCLEIYTKCPVATKQTPDNTPLFPREKRSSHGGGEKMRRGFPPGSRRIFSR